MKVAMTGASGFPVNGKIADVVSRFKFPGFRSLSGKIEAFSTTTTVDTSAMKNRINIQFQPTESILSGIASSALKIA